MDIDRIIGIVRNLKEEAPTMSVAGGGIAGLPPDQPPVFKKKKKKNEMPTIIGRGKFPGARARWSKGVQ
jgi:hypothetical protein